ncbi:MAG: phosphoglucosamine mutase, partial [Candidatus Aminicenantes bacterium]|nr:phosphoglucosamine mutase [Candidatus Aminicenantes bacterium]
MAGHMQEKGTLRSKCIVATPMSNMGLEKSLKKRGIELVRAPVGDRFVLEEMLNSKANLGGEQSGHTIFLDDCPTGDGILTSLKMLEVMLDKKTPLSQLVSEYEEFPQILLNVDVSKKEDFSAYSEIKKTMEQIKKTLGSKGRLNVRYSGTEPVARIMIESENRKKITEMANQLAEVITKYLG